MADETTTTTPTTPVVTDIQQLFAATENKLTLVSTTESEKTAAQTVVDAARNELATKTDTANTAKADLVATATTLIDALEVRYGLKAAS